MAYNLTTTLKAGSRRYARVTASAVVGAGIGALLFSTFLSTVAEPSHATQNLQASSTAAMEQSLPVRLYIPEIYLDASFEEPLGLNSDQTIEVPESYGKVGWYKNGVTPGEVGAAVILGHVDSYTGPAIFFRLKDLEVGDTIEVEREDGTIAVFVVERMEEYDQEAFPTQEVYGSIDHAGLRLVTCTGLFDRSTRSYTHNLVVYATLVGEKG